MVNSRSMAILCMLLLAPPSLVAQSKAQGRNIFILGGQSNMAGRGGVEKNATGQFEWGGSVLPESQPKPSILWLNPSLIWENASEPLHLGIDTGKCIGVSPGMAFANRLLMKPQVSKVLLVPCAIGGTKISEWQRGSNHYNNMVIRTKASTNEGGFVRALLWFQGESDAASWHDANEYKNRLETFVNQFREDIKLPGLPVIIVQIATYDRYRSYSDNSWKVRDAQTEVAKSMKKVALVDAKALVGNNGLNKDKVHLNTRSEVRVGIAMAEAYLSSFGQVSL